MRCLLFFSVSTGFTHQVTSCVYYCKANSAVDTPCIYFSIQHIQKHLLNYLLSYLITHSLTPWFRILFEKLFVTQLIKKYLASSRNPKVHYRAYKSPPLDPILSQLNPVRLIDTYLPKVYLDVILSPTPRSSQWSPAFGPPN
jgi:hypothetical protein